jgi:monooxygenase
MDEHGYRQCTPASDPSVAPQPFIDFSSGYVRRSIHKFPKQGSRRPWRLYQNYALDIVNLRLGAIDDGTLTFTSTPEPVAVAEPVAA